MSFNWLDVVIVLILVGAAAVESSRGFGQALLDALLLYGALSLATMSAPLLAARFPLATDPAASLGIAYGLLLTAFIGLAFLLGYWLHIQTQIDAGSCDRLFGLVTGAAVGMMFAHGFLRIVALNLTGGGDVIAGSFLGNEMLSFTTYHSLITSLTGEAPMQRQLPS